MKLKFGLKLNILATTEKQRRTYRETSLITVSLEHRKRSNSIGRFHCHLTEYYLKVQYKRFEVE